MADDNVSNRSPAKMEVGTSDQLVTLVKTCGACPEQYDAFLGEKQIGYLRLRHGYFYAAYPDASGKEVYEAYPRGDGCFEDEERDFYLRHAIQALLDAENNVQRAAPSVLYRITS